MNQDQKMKLAGAARAASKHAHCPYSKFHVGAALMDGQGRVHDGCNVENASYGLTCCAERSALFKAITEGVSAGEMVAMVIYTPGERVHTSCGACRQVMSELMSADAEVLCLCDSENSVSYTVSELLPDPFHLTDLH